MLVRLETGTPRRHARNRRPLAPRRIPRPYLYVCCCDRLLAAARGILLVHFTPGIQMRAKGHNEIELFLARMRIWRGTGKALIVN